MPALKLSKLTNHPKVEKRVLEKQRRYRGSIKTKIFSENPFYRDIKERQVNFYYPEISLLRLKDPIVYFPNHLITLGNEVYFDLCLFREDYRDIISNQEIVRTNLNSKIITNNNFHNYCHWTQESLSSAYYFIQNLSGLDNVILPNVDNGWQRSGLHALGFDVNHRPWLAKGQYQFESLEFLNSSDHSRARNILWSKNLIEIVERLRSVAMRQQKQVEPIEKIFVSRRDSDRRKFSNTDWLLSKLEFMGFQEVNLTSITLLEQVQLFSQAKSIVALHGAGLVNSIYCYPGTKIVEIQPPGLTSSNFIRLSVQFGLIHTLYQEFQLPDQETKSLHNVSWSITNKSHLLEILEDNAHQ
ncbi:MAG: glycosyltransferase family 61 protein [Pseudomonadota bacterium]